MCSDRDVLGNVEVMQLDFEMENFTSLSVTRRINWNIDYKGQNPPPDSEKVVTELTVVQRDIQAIIPLAMVRKAKWMYNCQINLFTLLFKGKLCKPGCFANHPPGHVLLLTTKQSKDQYMKDFTTCIYLCSLNCSKQKIAARVLLQRFSIKVKM